MLLVKSAKIAKFVSYDYTCPIVDNMANLSKIKRDQMIAFLESLKESHSDEASIQAFNEIENHIRDKKYGLVWEEHSEEVDDLLKENIPILTADSERRLCKDASLPWNFIIEGDNLQALYILQKTHKGKVDCIYIDPPYNTGARDWKYNNDYVDGTDVYRHSKWLSMMKNRLLLAKDLLNPSDSVLICTIDEKEYLRLGCLLEELFPEGRIQMVSVAIHSAGVSRMDFSRTDEYYYFVFLGNAAPKAVQLGAEWQSDGVKRQQEVRWESMLRSGNDGRRTDRPNMFFPALFNAETKEFLGFGPSVPLSISGKDYIAPKGTIAVLPYASDGSEARWRISADKALELYKMGAFDWSDFKNGKTTLKYLKPGEIQKIKDGEYTVVGYKDNGAMILSSDSYTPRWIPGTQWHVSSHQAGGLGGSVLIKNVLKTKRFDFPKSLYAVRDALKIITSGNPNAVIVDFFAGSGTTFHAVNLLNAEDGGKRRCIMVTNNEVSVDEEKGLREKGYNPGDAEWEKYGIAKFVTWPRTVCCIEGKDVDGLPLKGSYVIASDQEIKLSDGFRSNVKFFKCSWIPRKPEDYLLSNALCLHIKEMIEFQNAIEVDNVKNVLILNKEDFRRTILNADVRPHIERVWVNQNIIFRTEELKALKDIGYKYIPREFFGQELREAAE